MFSKLAFHVLFVCWIRVVLAGISSHQVLEKLEDAPFGWLKGDKPSPLALIKFRLAINSPDTLAIFEQIVIDISTPGHPSYGQHMKREQVRQLLRPSPVVTNQILSWLNSENISPDSIELDGNWLTFEAAVFQAERMLETEFFSYKNKDGDSTIVRALEYSVPSELRDYIQLIQPTTRFWEFSPLRGLSDEPHVVATTEDISAGCGTVVTPSCLRDLYGLYNTTSTPDPRNRLGIAGFLEQYARHSDFLHFMQLYASDQTDANFTVVSINGGQNDENSTKNSVEASLDLQYSISLAYRALVTFYTTGGRGPVIPDGESTGPSTNEPYLEQLHYLISLPDEDLPAVITMSYGEPEQSVPKSYATASCNLFAQLGARGVTVIFSSGDAGPGGSCESNDGSYRAKFIPGWPASCPFVTSVGGTFGSSPEHAVSFSGGGFSDYFDRPSYQESLVQTFLTKNGDQWQGLFNATGRGIPDISAQASRFMVRDHGVYLTVGGTSASAPVIAGIVSQLNAIRLTQGKPRLGFLNPWLYTTGLDGLTDIVDGASQGCAASPVHNAGWNATIGWDPATGLGTPFFPTLEKLVLL
ncbi:uncharacterized protein N7484_007252 [Penicillium longicatenatum]|uniref:uncharacterized protein n=1 Tax=Penicillium longicatenatum TaxID=1561947 RepID=UPI00254732CE|nr:uncharacterized protein N7484_007252 [Penicillium longicatenatum]KAJ5639390.1 hypothetical protein N7484_007252 [Penicillium longicatenatum]